MLVSVTLQQERMRAATNWAQTFSDDQHTKVGVMIRLADPTRLPIFGTNRLPMGVRKLPERLERPEKYLWIEHAERDGLMQVINGGYRTSGADMYLPWFPCPDCARAIVNARIDTLYCYAPTPAELTDDKWKFDRSLAILIEGGINIVDVPKETP